MLKADKELLLLPIISGIASLIVAASFVVPVFLTGDGSDEIAGSRLVLLLVLYLILAYITIFFNAALVSAANERLQGGDPTIRSALRGAARRAGRILPWAFVSAVVSVILRALEERAGFVGRIVIAFVGVAWSVVTFLVLPIIVIEGVGTTRALKKSGRLVREAWGENLAAHVGFGVVGFILILPTVALGFAGFVSGGLLGGAAIGVGVLWAILVGAAISALTGIYQTALYHFAVSGQVPSGYFDHRAMQSAFEPKRRRRR